MSRTIESTLFFDPQAQKAAQFCPECGCELYEPSFVCIRCERRRP